MRTMHWITNEGNGRSRRKRNTRNPAPAKPMQSELSKRWISECLERGPASKKEAILKVQEEVESGKDVGFSMPFLATLVKDKDQGVCIKAAQALGICASRDMNPIEALPNLVSMLHKSDDPLVEAAIKAIGRCAKHPSLAAKKILLNKLVEINKNGASQETKSNAGFALAESFTCAPDLTLNKPFRTKARSMFSRLLESDHYPSKVSGALGIGWIAISYAKSGDSPHANSMLKLLPVYADDVLTDVVLSSTLLSARHCPSCLTPGILQASVLMLVSSVNARNVETAREIVGYGLDQSGNRLPLMEMLFGAGTTAHRVLAEFEFEPEARALVELKKKTIEGLIKYGRAKFASEGKRVVIHFNANSKGLINSFGLPSSVDSNGLA